MEVAADAADETVEVVPVPDDNAPADERTARRVPVLPTWFVAGLAAAIVWFLTAGLLGLALLVAHRYQPTVIIVAASVAAVAMGWGTATRLGRRHAVHGPAIIAVGVALVFLILAAGFHSEHLLTDRDPGIYVNTGRSIARTHELHPVIRTGAFRNRRLYSLEAASFGERHGRLRPNFFPLLPVLLALGWSIGGDSGLLMISTVLGTLGILAVYALASRILGSRGGLIALLLLVLFPLQLWFARDAYSELAVQVFLWGGLWLYTEARPRYAAVFAGLGGLLVGTTVLARIDAVLLALGVIGFVGIEWIRADHDPEPERARRVVGSFGFVFGASLAAALITTSRVAHGYVNALRVEYRQGIYGVLVALVAAVALVVIHRADAARLAKLVHSRTLAIVAGVATAAAFVWAFWWRPAGNDARPAHVERMTKTARQAVNHWHWSYSLRWFSSYLGFVALVCAVVGFGMLALRARRGNRAAAAVFLVAVPVAALYLNSPHIAPDQPWAMRRFLPVVIPAIAVAIAVVFVTLASARRRLQSSAMRTLAAIAIGVLALTVAVPMGWAAKPFVHARMQHGALAAVHTLCRTVGDDGAVLVYGFQYMNLVLPQTVRGFCGVPAAKPRNNSTVDIPLLAARWHKAGRRLFVATAEPAKLRNADPSARQVLRVQIADDDEPRRTRDIRPGDFQPRAQTIWVFEIPVPADAA